MQEKFRWVITKDDDVHISPKPFLTFKACQKDLKKLLNQRGGQYSFDYTYDVSQLMETVILYLLLIEYNAKMGKSQSQYCTE